MNSPTIRVAPRRADHDGTLEGCDRRPKAVAIRVGTEWRDEALADLSGDEVEYVGCPGTRRGRGLVGRSYDYETSVRGDRGAKPGERLHGGRDEPSQQDAAGVLSTLCVRSSADDGTPGVEGH